MASSPLVLPGVLFVGEDERQRLSAHFGPAAGWMTPKGILQWSSEVSVVPREALTEDIRRDTKAVMPEEQIPPARFPLTLEAAKRSPLVAVSSKLTSKLVEKGVRVHTIGVDRMTSSFFYIAEGGTEEPMTVSGDLVQAVAEMLGDRADNAAIERVLDSLVDRLLRSLSKERVTELGVELAASLPRAADDGSGAQGVELEDFEKDLAKLVGNSEKYAAHLQDISDKIVGSTDRKVDVPLYVDARKVPQGPFELQLGDRKISLGTYERWVMTGPFTEPSAKAAPAAAAPAPKSEPKAESKPEPKPESKPQSSPKPAEVKQAAKPQPSPKPAEAKPAPKSDPKAADKATSPTPAPAKAAALAAPITPAKPTSDRPPPPRPASKSRPDLGEVMGAPIQGTPIIAAAKEAFAGAAEAATSSPGQKIAEPAAEPRKAEEPKVEPPKAEEPKPIEAKVESPKVEEPKPEPKAEAKADTPKIDEKKKAEHKDLDVRGEDAVKKKPTAEPEKKGGFPWLIVLILVAVAIVVYQVFLSGKK